MMKRFEVHSNLVSSTRLWFSLNKSIVFALPAGSLVRRMVASSFEHLKVCHRLSFLPSPPILPADPVAGLGRPFSEITNTSAYRQLYCAAVIFKIAVDKKVVNFFNLSFLKLLFK